jgi:hypothetical protein
MMSTTQATAVFGRRAAAKTAWFRIENKRALPRIGKNHVAKKKGERGEWWRTHRNQNDNKRVATKEKQKTYQICSSVGVDQVGKQKRKARGYDKSPRWHKADSDAVG